MKIFLKTCLFMLGVMFFTGGACPSTETTPSDRVAQSEIYQSYRVAQNGANYDVTAYFRIGGKTGTTLALSPPSKVTFNGTAMQAHLNTPSGTFYTATVPAGTTNGTFSFTDQNSKTYSNQIDLSRTALTLARLRVNGTSPVALPLARPPSESATFDLDLNGQNVFLSPSAGENSEAYFDRARNSIVVLPGAWKKVAGGNVEVDLEVRSSKQTQQGTALGGEMTFEYTASPVYVALAKAKGSGRRKGKR